MYEVDPTQLTPRDDDYSSELSPSSTHSESSSSTSSADPNNDDEEVSSSGESTTLEVEFENIAEKRRKLNKKREKKDVYDFEDMFNF
jgi:hypothetical protein